MRLLLTGFLFTMGCVKSYQFSTPLQKNLPENVIVKRILMAESTNTDTDYLKVEISNTSQTGIFIRWDRSQIKIGDNSLTKMRVNPRHVVSFIPSSNTSVFGLYPNIEPDTSNFGSTLIVAPERLEEGAVQVIIGLEYCASNLQDGFSPVQCAADGNGWSKAMVKSELTIQDE